MALRTLLWLGEHQGKWLGRPLRNRVAFLPKINYCKTLLEVQTSSRLTRGFKRLRDARQGSLSTSLGSREISLRGQLWKPLGFTILFGSAAHVGAVIWEYERVRGTAYKVINRFPQWRAEKFGWREQGETWWRNLSESQQVFAVICYLNALVFLAWKVPALQSTMTRYFVADPSAKSVCLPMLLSTFSHASLLHLGVNMYVLNSFGTMAVPTLGREQFVALYLTSGVMASFASHVYKTARVLPGMSLGASGAIMGTVSFICMQYPDSRVAIVFLPMLAFTAGTALKGLLCMDTLGCILGWRFLDHAAHLGGALWGVFWQSWGCAHIWQKREPILSAWHSIRDPKRPH